MGTKLLLRKSGGNILSFGDSVTVGANDPTGGYILHLNEIMNAEAGGVWTATNKSVGSNTIPFEATSIDGRLVGTITPRFVTLLFGQNDQWYSYTEPAWKTAYRYILDAIHTKHPTTPIYLGLGSYSMNAMGTFWQYMLDLVAERPAYCFMGISQPVLFEGHILDYMCGESSHPCTPGHLALARAWADLLIATL